MGKTRGEHRGFEEHGAFHGADRRSGVHSPRRSGSWKSTGDSRATWRGSTRRSPPPNLPRPLRSGSRAWPRVCASCFPFLQAHFGREEEDGLFERIQAAWPHAARTCKRLQDEHRTLLARLERLGAECEKDPLAEEALRVLVAHVRSLLGDLVCHEELENELLCGSLDDALAAQD